jgi:hypothetical protein
MLREMKASEYPRAGPTGSEDGACDQSLDLARPALNTLPKTVDVTARNRERERGGR